MYKLILFLCIAGCVAPAKKTISIDYLTKNEISGLTSVEISKELTRLTTSESSNPLANGSSLAIEATFITSALIDTQEKEDGKRLLKNENEVSKAIEEKKKKLVNKQKCFSVTIYTPDPIDNAKFSNLTAKIKTASGDMLDMNFSNLEGVDSIPEIYRGISSSARPWTNSSYAFSQKDFDASAGFTLMVIPNLLRNNKPAEMIWTFSNSSKNNGSK
jgi:hypothetical protein